MGKGLMENWYYLDKDGYMKTGWQQINGIWYYMDQSGVMQNGWFKDNDKWYFLLPNGAMAVNTTIDGRRLDRTAYGFRQRDR